MADTDDALKHFINSNDDPYTLLDLPNGPASTEKEVRGAWKKTALKYHPDKLRAKDNQVDEATANRLYILRQDAYGILSEPHLKEQYDNALRAKEAKKQRDAAFTGLRKSMKEDLERRENAAKRKREEDDVGEAELERLRRDGQRRRRERAEMLRRQAEEEEREMREMEDGGGEINEIERKSNGTPQVQDIDRAVTSRFPVNDGTGHLTRERVTELFSRFGSLEGVTLREKKFKVNGEKHRRVFMTVAAIFERIVGAHAAVSDFSEVAEREQGDWKLLDPPAWASGREPNCIPRPQQPSQPQETQQPSAPGSYDGASAGGDVDDVLMIRLKNAEKKRREDKRRREEEAAAASAKEEADTAALSPKRSAPTFASFKAKTAAIPGSDDVDKKRDVEKRRLEEELRRQEEEEDRRAATNGTPA